MVKDDKKMNKEIKKDEKQQMIEEMRAAKGQAPSSLSQKKEAKKEEPSPKTAPVKVEHHDEPKREDHIEKQFKFYDEDKKPHGILETNMLKKEPEKPLADYQIKEILQYGDKVKDQSEGGRI